MRTVHETEALRPSDPIPKSMQSVNKSSRVKLVVKTAQSTSGRNLGTDSSATGKLNGDESSYPDELGFTAEEEAMGSLELWRLLRRQLHWAEEEADALKRECEVIEEIRKKEWLEKEILLDQVIKNEISWHERRQEVLGGVSRIPTAEEIRAAAAEEIKAKAANVGAKIQLKEDPREAAAVLASLHQA